MGFAANFTAIDFETANRRSDSACQLAAVVVRNGEIVDEKMWMIRPEPFYFSPTNIRIHGIRPQDVRDEPNFGELWSDIKPYLVGDCLIAHHAAFDLGVLTACFQKHSVDVPELEYSCTRLIARRTWTGRRRYGLKPLASWLGVEFRHHDALEDSIACAKILLAAGIDKQADDLPSLEKKLRIARGKVGPWGISRPGRKSPSAVNQKTPSRVAQKSNRSNRPQVRESTPEYWTGNDEPQEEPVIDWQRLAIRAEFVQPLRGQRVVFSGSLSCMTKQQAEGLTQRCGGTIQPIVDAQTTFLVTGKVTENVDAESTARELNRDGNQICIIDEQEFLELFTSSPGSVANEVEG